MKPVHGTRLPDRLVALVEASEWIDTLLARRGDRWPDQATLGSLCGRADPHPRLTGFARLSPRLEVIAAVDSVERQRRIPQPQPAARVAGARSV